MIRKSELCHKLIGLSVSGSTGMRFRLSVAWAESVAGFLVASLSSRLSSAQQKETPSFLRSFSFRRSAASERFPLYPPDCGGEGGGRREEERERERVVE